MPVFDKLAGTANREAMIKKLDHLGYLVHNAKGGVKRYGTVNKAPARCLTFTPSAWAGSPSQAEAEECPQGKPTIDELFD